MEEDLYPHLHSNLGISHLLYFLYHNSRYDLIWKGILWLQKVWKPSPKMIVVVTYSASIICQAFHICCLQPAVTKQGKHYYSRNFSEKETEIQSSSFHAKVTLVVVPNQGVQFRSLLIWKPIIKPSGCWITSLIEGSTQLVSFHYQEERHSQILTVQVMAVRSAEMCLDSSAVELYSRQGR